MLGIFGFIGCTKMINDSAKSRYFFETCAFMPKKKQIYYKIYTLTSKQARNIL